MIPPKLIVLGTRFRRPALLTGRETRVGDRRRGRSGAKYKRVGATRFERATSTSRRPTLRTLPVVYSPPFPGKTTLAGVWRCGAGRASGTANGTTTGTKTGRIVTAPVLPRRSPTAPPPRISELASAPSSSSATPTGHRGSVGPQPLALPAGVQPGEGVAIGDPHHLKVGGHCSPGEGDDQGDDEEAIHRWFIGP
jgi:hypothetical protein